MLHTLGFGCLAIYVCHSDYIEWLLRATLPLNRLNKRWNCSKLQYIHLFCGFCPWFEWDCGVIFHLVMLVHIFSSTYGGYTMAQIVSLPFSIPLGCKVPKFMREKTLSCQHYLQCDRNLLRTWAAKIMWLGCSAEYCHREANSFLTQCACPDLMF